MKKRVRQGWNTYYMLVNNVVRKYMSEMGKKGGAKSKRTLTPEQIKMMADARRKKKKLSI